MSLNYTAIVNLRKNAIVLPPEVDNKLVELVRKHTGARVLQKHSQFSRKDDKQPSKISTEGEITIELNKFTLKNYARVLNKLCLKLNSHKNAAGNQPAQFDMTIFLSKVIESAKTQKLFSFALGMLASDILIIQNDPLHKLLLRNFLQKIPNWNVKEAEGIGRFLSGLYCNNKYEVVPYLEKLLSKPTLEEIMCLVFYFLGKYQEKVFDLEYDDLLYITLEETIEKMTIPMVHKVHFLDLRDLRKKNVNIN